VSTTVHTVGTSVVRAVQLQRGFNGTYPRARARRMNQDYLVTQARTHARTYTHTGTYIQKGRPPIWNPLRTNKKLEGNNLKDFLSKRIHYELNHTLFVSREKKVKLSHYGPGQTLRAPEGWGCQDF
jgi:hypothetical protein